MDLETKLAALRPSRPAAPRDVCAGCWLLDEVVPAGERELVAAALEDSRVAVRSLADTLRDHYKVSFSYNSVQKHRAHLAGA
jgi:hypothetical protein